MILESSSFKPGTKPSNGGRFPPMVSDCTPGCVGSENIGRCLSTSKLRSRVRSDSLPDSLVVLDAIHNVTIHKQLTSNLDLFRPGHNTSALSSVGFLGGASLRLFFAQVEIV